MSEYHDALKEQVAVVTGGGRGIAGRSPWDTPQQAQPSAVRRELRARLNVVAAEIEGSGGRSMALPVDVTDRNRVEQLFTEIVSAWGRVDILVVCAGITADSHTAEESDPGAWEDVISVNLLEAYHCARAAVPT